MDWWFALSFGADWYFLHHCIFNEKIKIILKKKRKKKTKTGSSGNHYILAWSGIKLSMAWDAIYF